MSTGSCLRSTCASKLSRSVRPQPVTTQDNLVVEIDTVLYSQVTDPRAAAYEIPSYPQAVEQLTVTTLHSVLTAADLAPATERSLQVRLAAALARNQRLQQRVDALTEQNN